MLGQTGWVPGLLPRMRAAERTVSDFANEAPQQVGRLIARILDPPDAALSAASWQKTCDELQRGIALGPFDSLEDVPVANPAVVIRKGIWEKHGMATEYTVRNIDDFLVSGAMSR